MHRSPICFLLALALAIPTFARAEQEIDIGRTAVGQLKLKLEFEQPVALPRSVFPGISGYVTTAMGVHSFFPDDPANDIYELSTEADFRLILLNHDPGMEVWNDHGSGYMTNGESFYVGPAAFDTHPVWNIPVGVYGNIYSLTMKVRDLNGIYPDSDPFTLSFTPVAPAQLSIEDNRDGSVTVTFHGTPGGEYIVQRSGNLSGNWVNLSTNIAGSDGTWTLTESTTNQTQQYFRCVNP